MTATATWPLALRFLFRFFCCYWPLYIAPPPIEQLWRTIVPIAATKLFHVTGPAATYFQTGSGDTTLAYVKFFLGLNACLLAAVIWSILDRRRAHYRSLHAWLRLFIRYSLASILLSYGFAKVIPSQFPPNSLVRLSQTYGDFSPMGVLWSFMGASQPYTIFAGFAEVIPAVLLFFRRTTTLGALGAAAVMANIVALNFFYDVPVKLYSSHLLLMAIFLLAPDAQRLVNVLILNRPAAPADLSLPHFPPGKWRIVSQVIWVAVVGMSLIVGPYQSYLNLSRRTLNRPPLYGLYRVEQETSSPWRLVIIDRQENLAVRLLDDSLERFKTEYDTAASTVTFNNITFHWTFPDSTHLLLTSDKHSIRLRKLEIPLTARGFHWINEYPFNR